MSERIEKARRCLVEAVGIGHLAWGLSDVAGALAGLIAAVREDEREACALVAENEAMRPKKLPHWHAENQAYTAAGIRIAGEIRKRGEP